MLKKLEERGFLSLKSTIYYYIYSINVDGLFKKPLFKYAYIPTNFRGIIDALNFMVNRLL